MKTLLKIGLVLVVLIAGGVWYLASNIDEIVRRMVETVGTETMQTEVSLQSAQIELGSESAATLKGLTIANPAGFELPYAFELNAVGASLDAASVSSDVIVIPTVAISGAKLTFEQVGSDSNLQQLLDNMESGSAGSDSAADSSEDVLLAIGELRLSDTGVTVISDQLGKPFEFVLDDVVVKNIGRPDAGVTPDQAAEQIVDPVIDAVMKQAKQQLKKAIEAEVDARVEQEKAKLKEKSDEKKDEVKESLRDKLKF